MNKLQHFISTEDFNGALGTAPVVDGDGVTENMITLHQTPETAHVTAELDDINTEYEDVAEAQVAVESYLELLNASKNGITAETAAFMRVGLEHFAHVMPAEGKVIPSLEDFGGTASRQVATTASVDSLKEKSASLGARAKELLAKLVEWAKKVYASVFDDMTRLQARNEALVKKIAALPASPAQKTIQISNPSSLMIGTRFAPDDLTGVAHLAQWVGTSYPQKVNVRSQVIASGVKNDFASIPSENITADLASAKELPGNTTITADGTWDKFKVDVVAKPGAAESTSWGVQTPNELKKRVDLLQKMITDLGKARNFADNLDANFKKMTDAVAKEGKGEEQVENYMRSVVNAPVKVLAYVTKVIGMAQAVINQEISAYGSGEAK